MKTKVKWHKVSSKDDLSEKEVRIAFAGDKQICLSKLNGKIGAIDNSCPHQGGPLGHGKIIKGYVVCPWHAWEFDPQTGNSPGGFDDGVDAYKVEKRKDGIYIAFPEKEKPLTVSDQIIDVLKDWGVKAVFGLAGHSNLPLVDGIKKTGKIKFVSVRHEGCASFAASAYGKLTGEPGVCLTIAGPGSTNLLTGLYDAKMDRSPVVALTGQIKTQVLGPNVFQEVDLEAAFEDVTVWNQTIYSEQNASYLTGLALKYAIDERNVTQLVLPDEVQKMKGEIKKIKKVERIVNKEIIPDQKQLEKAVQIINNSKKPGIVIGFGAKGYKKQIIKLAEKIMAPLMTTFKAKGIVGDNHPLACGVLGSAGVPFSYQTMNKSDLLIVLGSSFSEKTYINPKKTIIQIDFDPLSIGKKEGVTLGLLGDVGKTLEVLEKRVKIKTNNNIKKEIAANWIEWRKVKKQRADASEKNGIQNAFVMQALTELAPEDAVITIDVGNNAYSFGRYFESKNQEFVLSGYLGSIGFALPAAIGAHYARPDKKIICVCGDGGLSQYLGEISTLVQYNIPVCIVLLNNSELAKISAEQRAEDYNIFATELKNPNFSKYAENCGAVGTRVEKNSELKKTLSEALKLNKPCLVEIITDPVSE